MNTSLARLLPVLLLICSCSIPLERRTANGSDAEPTGIAAATQSADPAAECSRLRADIASAQHNQRNAPPTSSSPIIAAASEGKADQRIDELQQRLDRLGCEKNPPGGKALDANSVAPSPK